MLLHDKIIVKNMILNKLMKTKRNSLLLLLVTFILCSCDSNLYDPTAIKEVKNVTELNVPAGFDWNMNTSLTVNIVSTTNTRVAFYVSPDCADESQLANVLSYANSPKNLTLSVPTFAKEIYAKFAKQSGEEVIEKLVVTNQLASIVLPTDSKKEVISKSMRVITKSDEMSMSNSIINYPAKGWGTIMFEDMFPNLGDYDFNDMVVYHSEMLYLDEGDLSTVMGLNIGVAIRALGADKKSDLYLNLKGIKNSDVDYVEFYGNDLVGPQYAVRLNEENLDKDALFSFAGMMENLSKNPGSKYLNTDPKSLTSSMNKVNFVIYFKEPVSVSRIGYNVFDYFIANESKTVEVHMKGNPSIFTPYNAGAGLNPTVPYFSQNGLVWAINIPWTAKHLIEKENFLNAYPKFKGWVESNGTLNTDWYKSPVRAHIMPLQ